MDVSVVVPTMGRPDRLRRALDSIVSQTHSPAEIAVVDGGNNNTIHEIVSEYDAAIYLEQPSDRMGLAAARNIGIEETSAQFVAFLDDDDYWRPMKLAKQCDALDATGAGLSCTAIEHVESDGKTTTIRQPPATNDGCLNNQILTRNAIGAPSSVIVHRGRLSTVGGFDESFRSREEWELWIRLCDVCEIATLSEPLTVKETHENTISGDSNAIERDRPRVLEKHYDKYNQSTEQLFWANYHFELGRVAMNHGRVNEARSHFIQSLRHRLIVERIGYLLATAGGQRGYDIVRAVHRAIKKISMTDVPFIV